jgi:5-hydroxyisourate hydrolase
MPPSTPSTRARALSNHLHNSANPPQAAAMAAPKPPITCHVLDTSIGKPAASIPVRLTLLSCTPPSPSNDTAPSFTATTNADGRVTSWISAPAPFTSAASLADVFSAGPGAQKWELRFDTAAYFAGRGVQTFFPECVVVFVVRE